MPYQAEISRRNPSCFLFLIDQSGSMVNEMDLWPANSRPKSVFLADALNKILQRLVLRCSKGPEIRDFFHVGVIGFGTKVEPVLANSNIDNELVPISVLGKNPLRIEERVEKISENGGGIIEKRAKLPIWVEPTAKGATPMNSALKYAKKILETWISKHPNSYPPIVFSLTDGAATDGDPRENFKNLSSMSTSDGPVLIFNVHISSTIAPSFSFPPLGASMPDEHAKMLFETSSHLTPYQVSVAPEYDLKLGDSPKFFVFNGNASLTVLALEIGTRPSNLR